MTEELEVLRAPTPASAARRARIDERKLQRRAIKTAPLTKEVRRKTAHTRHAEAVTRARESMAPQLESGNLQVDLRHIAVAFQGVEPRDFEGPLASVLHDLAQQMNDRLLLRDDFHAQIDAHFDGQKERDGALSAKKRTDGIAELDAGDDADWSEELRELLEIENPGAILCDWRHDIPQRFIESIPDLPAFRERRKAHARELGGGYEAHTREVDRVRADVMHREAGITRLDAYRDDASREQRAAEQREIDVLRAELARVSALAEEAGLRASAARRVASLVDEILGRPARHGAPLGLGQPSEGIAPRPQPTGREGSNLEPQPGTGGRAA